MKAQVAIIIAAGLTACLAAPAAHVFVPHVASQYHAQDELGQYTYGYSGGPSAKHEQKTLDGITRGGYSYVDGHGLVQSAAYVSDPVNGFRVAATNLPAGPAVPVKQEVVASAVIAPSAAIAVPAPAPVVALPAPILPVSAVATPIVPVPAIAAPLALGSIAISPVVEKSAAPAPVEEPMKNDEPIEVSAEPVENNSEVDEAVSDAVVEEVPETPIQNTYTSVEDLPEVAQAKAAHLAAVEEAKARNAAQEVKDAAEIAAAPVAEAVAPKVAAVAKVDTIVSAPVLTAVAPAPIAVAVAPAPVVAVPAVAHAVVPQQAVLTKTVLSVPAAAPVVRVAAPAVAVPVAQPAVALTNLHIASQYHAQDELGQYVYGYSGGPSAKHEEKTLDGITKGGYSYVDAHGLVQSAAYVSDSVGGFRVAASNIPKQVLPAYIPDSPEVEHAKQALFKAQAEHIAKL